MYCPAVIYLFICLNVFICLNIGTIKHEQAYRLQSYTTMVSNIIDCIPKELLHRCFTSRSSRLVCRTICEEIDRYQTDLYITDSDGGRVQDMPRLFDKMGKLEHITIAPLLHGESDIDLLSALPLHRLLSMDFYFTQVFWDTDVDTLEPLKQCGKLQSLWMTSANMHDFSSLNLLGLSQLSMRSSNISNLLSLKTSSLTSLCLDQCYGYVSAAQAETYAATPSDVLAHLTSLTSLSITNSNIWSVAPLANHPSLVNLDLSGSRVVKNDVHHIGTLSKLRSLSLNYVDPVTDMRWISTLTDLTSLGSVSYTHLTLPTIYSV